jgi:hypothetical protein
MAQVRSFLDGEFTEFEGRQISVKALEEEAK